MSERWRLVELSSLPDFHVVNTCPQKQGPTQKHGEDKKEEKAGQFYCSLPDHIVQGWLSMVLESH